MTAELAEIHHIWDSLVNALAIFFNGLLLYFIAFHSSKGMRPYQILLGIDASLDFFLSGLMLAAQPVVVALGTDSVPFDVPCFEKKKDFVFCMCFFRAFDHSH